MGLGAHSRFHPGSQGPYRGPDRRFLCELLHGCLQGLRIFVVFVIFMILQF